MSRQQHRRNMAYNRNYVPPGWQFESGYAMWRMSRNMPLNEHTYRRYTHDRAWHNRMSNSPRAQQILMGAYDWTVEEIALFMHQNQNLFKFHPSGYEN